MNKKMSPELQEKLAAVQGAAGALRSKHYGWIVNAACDHFAGEIKSAEVDIVRHEHFAADPHMTTTRTRATDRSAVLAELREALPQYRAILQFLHALRDAIVIANAEQAAEELVRSGFFSKR